MANENRTVINAQAREQTPARSPARPVRRSPTARPASSAGVTPRFFRTIVLPVDGSVASTMVAEWGIRFARVFGATVHVTQAVNLDDYFLGGANAMGQARVNLSNLEDSAEQEGVKVKAHLCQGPAVEQILKVAREVKADLIIMGSHSRGSIATLFLGSVSRGVLQQPPCLVMVYGENVENPVPTLERAPGK